jgi:hypothetical protein
MDVSSLLMPTEPRSQQIKPYSKYHASPSEEYVLSHSKELGLEETTSLPATCAMWTSNTATPMHDSLQEYVRELDEYNRLVKDFKPVPDVRQYLNDPTQDVCQRLELHPDGLPGIFKSGQLSYTTTSGYVEPLLPPLRHPRFCLDGKVHKGKNLPPTNVKIPDSRVNGNYILDLGYLVSLSFKGS